MATYRPRGVSPPPPRRFGESRVLTTPVFSTAFDTRYAQQPRNSLDTLTSSRAGAERHFDAQPISRREYAASGHSAAQSKTEYAVRPRNNSNVGVDGRAPLRILAPPASPSRTRPVVNNFPQDRPRSPLTKHYHPLDGSDRYILPAVSSPRHHGPQISTGPADSSRLAPIGRERRERNGYRLAGSRVYPTGGALVPYDDEDDYSYTTPREQFDRDYPPPEPRPRRNSYVRKDRPTSTSDYDDWKGIPQSRRDPGPPPAVRQFDKIGDADGRHPISRSGNYSDTERASDKPRRRHSVRVPVSLHQDPEQIYAPHRDERPARGASQFQSKVYDEELSYSSDRENYRPGSHDERHYERHQQRPRVPEESRDRSGKSHGVAAAGLGGLVAAGLTGAVAKKAHEQDDDFERDELREVKDRYVRERDHKPREISRERERIIEKPRDRAAELREQAAPREQRREKGKKERSDSDSIDDGYPDGHRRRRKHRRHRRDSRPQESESDSTSDERKRVGVSKDADRDRSERDSAQEESDRPRRDRRHSHAGLPIDGEKDDDLEARVARLQLVEPAKEKELEPKPKGILKPARQVPFPEDPNPTREGVAPLKDAGKKGVPPGARWTKINRMLVNPAALEAAHERYEERDDYVIVLRVLAREEIQKFADMTKEIRGKDNWQFLGSSVSLTVCAEARELEWQERQERRRRKDGRKGGSDDSSDEDRGPPLAIEAAPPPALSTDTRYHHNNPSTTDSRPESDAAAMNNSLGIRT